MLEYFPSSSNGSWCSGDLVIRNGKILKGKELVPYLPIPPFYPMQVVVRHFGDTIFLCRDGRLWDKCFTPIPFEGGPIIAIRRIICDFYILTKDGVLWINKKDRFIPIPTLFLPISIHASLSITGVIDSEEALHCYNEDMLINTDTAIRYKQVQHAYVLETNGTLKYNDVMVKDKVTIFSLYGDNIAMIREDKVYYNDKLIPLSFVPLQLCFMGNSALAVKGKGDELLAL